jgi:putative transposase
LDYEKHCDYIHWKPVKHGLVNRVQDRPYSSFHQFTQQGINPQNWAGMKDKVVISGDEFGE